jgi:hypothetical protein
VVARVRRPSGKACRGGIAGSRVNAATDPGSGLAVWPHRVARRQRHGLGGQGCPRRGPARTGRHFSSTSARWSASPPGLPTAFARWRHGFLGLRMSAREPADDGRHSIRRGCSDAREGASLTLPFLALALCHETGILFGQCGDRFVPGPPRMTRFLARGPGSDGLSGAAPAPGAVPAGLRPDDRAGVRLVEGHRDPLRTAAPGELAHMDVKKIGRIPDGGGCRATAAQAARPPETGPPWSGKTTSTPSLTITPGWRTPRSCPTRSAPIARGSRSGPSTASPATASPGSSA